jgi:hypothetical protein
LTVTVDDPKFYTKPWTWMRASFYWMKSAGLFRVPLHPVRGDPVSRLALAKPSGIDIK